jgi:hypothetical protein
VTTPRPIRTRLIHSVIPSEARNPYRPHTAGGFHRSLQRRTFTLSCLLLLTLLPVPGASGRLAAAPQKPTKAEYALIFGTVWGPDNRPAYGIPVKIRRAQDKKAKWEVYSDHHGEFAQRVPPGEADYFLTADLKGVKTADGKPLHQVGEVKVHVDYDEREDTGLHLAP